MLARSAGFRVFLLVLASGMLVGLAVVAPAPPEYVASAVIWEQGTTLAATDRAAGAGRGPIDAERSGGEDGSLERPPTANPPGRAAASTTAIGADAHETTMSAELLLTVLERDDVLAEVGREWAAEPLKHLRQRLDVTITPHGQNAREIVVRYRDSTPERALVLCRAVAESYVARARNTLAQVRVLTPEDVQRRAAKAKQRVEAIQADIDRLLRDVIADEEAARETSADTHRRPDSSGDAPSTGTSAGTGIRLPGGEGRSRSAGHEYVFVSRRTMPPAAGVSTGDRDYEFGRAVHGQAVDIPPAVPGGPLRPPIGTSTSALPGSQSNRWPSGNPRRGTSTAGEIQARQNKAGPRDEQPSEPVKPVAERLHELQQERTRLLETLTPAHPKVQLLDALIEDLRRVHGRTNRGSPEGSDSRTSDPTLDRPGNERPRSIAPSLPDHWPPSPADGEARDTQPAPWQRLPSVDAEPSDTASGDEPEGEQSPSATERAPAWPSWPMLPDSSSGGLPPAHGEKRPPTAANDQRETVPADSAADEPIGNGAGGQTQGRAEKMPGDRPDAAGDRSTTTDGGPESDAHAVPAARLAEYRRLREQLRDAIESYQQWLAAEVEARESQALRQNATVEIVSSPRIESARNLHVRPQHLARVLVVALFVAAVSASLTRWKHRKLLDAADAAHCLSLPVLRLSERGELVLPQTKRRASWTYRVAVWATVMVAALTAVLLAGDPMLRYEFRGRPLTATARAVDRILPL